MDDSNLDKSHDHDNSNIDPAASKRGTKKRKRILLL